MLPTPALSGSGTWVGEVLSSPSQPGYPELPENICTNCRTAAEKVNWSPWESICMYISPINYQVSTKRCIHGAQCHLLRRT